MLWLVHLISVISSYTLVWPYMAIDCAKWLLMYHFISNARSGVSYLWWQRLFYNPRQNCWDSVSIKDVRAKIFQHWFFSETFTTVRWWVSYVRNVKKMGGHRLRFGENMPGKTPKMWQNRATLANKASVCKPKYIAIKSLKWNLLCQILFKWTY